MYKWETLQTSDTDAITPPYDRYQLAYRVGSHGNKGQLAGLDWSVETELTEFDRPDINTLDGTRTVVVANTSHRFETEPALCCTAAPGAGSERTPVAASNATTFTPPPPGAAGQPPPHQCPPAHRPSHCKVTDGGGSRGGSSRQPWRQQLPPRRHLDRRQSSLSATTRGAAGDTPGRRSQISGRSNNVSVDQLAARSVQAVRSAAAVHGGTRGHQPANKLEVLHRDMLHKLGRIGQDLQATASRLETFGHGQEPAGGRV